MNRTWHNHPRTYAYARRLKVPYENISFGESPEAGYATEDALALDAIINVSDLPGVVFESPAHSSQRLYWFPIDEYEPWSLPALHAAWRTLDFHHDLGHNIVVHCLAGRNRSPGVLYWWLRSRGHAEADIPTLLSLEQDEIFHRRLQVVDGFTPTWILHFATAAKHTAKAGTGDLLFQLFTVKERHRIEGRTEVEEP